jgi:hypothetical protein
MISSALRRDNLGDQGHRIKPAALQVVRMQPARGGLNAWGMLNISIAEKDIVGTQRFVKSAWFRRIWAA